MQDAQQILAEYAAFVSDADGWELLEQSEKGVLAIHHHVPTTSSVKIGILGLDAWKMTTLQREASVPHEPYLDMRIETSEEAEDDGSRSIRDKANLVLGSLLMDEEDFSQAQLSFDRVRLEGPLSNQALLSAGWASAAAGNYERAIVPWGILAERERTDAAVQEARPCSKSRTCNTHFFAVITPGVPLRTQPMGLSPAQNSTAERHRVYTTSRSRSIIKGGTA